MPVYANEPAWKDLRRIFKYIFEPDHVGGGLPQLIPHTVYHNSPFAIGDVQVTPLEVIHGKLPVIAYRFNDFAYATDLNFISDETIELMQGLDVLVLDCVRIRPHPTHLGLNEALAYIERIKPRRAYLTHLNHDVMHDAIQNCCRRMCSFHMMGSSYRMNHEEPFVTFRRFTNPNRCILPASSRSSRRILIDAKQPAVYLTFVRAVHIETPDKDDEKRFLIFKITNNTRWGIWLDMSGGDDAFKKIGIDSITLYYAVDDVDSGKILFGSTSCHVCSTNPLPPGKSILFPVVQTRVVAGAKMRLEYSFDWDRDVNLADSSTSHYVNYYFRSLPQSILSQLKE